MLQSRGKRTNGGMRDHEMDLMGFGGFGSAIMQRFGMGFERDFFNMDPFNDPFEEIESFSKVHKRAHDKKSDGAFYCETFVQSSKMGDNGKMVTEKYYDRNYGEHKGGNTISEKQQAYQNSKGQKRLAEEQMINNKGRKVIKDKHSNGEVEEKYNYYNIDPEDDFEREWNNMNNQIGFRDNVRRLGYDKKGNVQEMMAIQGYPSQSQNRGYRNSNLNRSKMRELEDQREYGRSSERPNHNASYTNTNKYGDTQSGYGASKVSSKSGQRAISQFGKSSSSYKDGNQSYNKGSRLRDADSYSKGNYNK